FGGDLAEARARYEASRLAAVEVGSRYGEGLAKLGIAVTLGFAGELAEAQPIYDELTMPFRLFAPKHNTAYLLHYHCDLLAAAARKAYEEALQTRVTIGEKLQAQRDQLSLAELALDEGRPAETEREARAVGAAGADLTQDDAATAQALLARALRAQGKTVEA